MAAPAPVEPGAEPPGAEDPAPETLAPEVPAGSPADFVTLPVSPSRTQRSPSRLAARPSTVREGEASAKRASRTRVPGTSGRSAEDRATSAWSARAPAAIGSEAL